MSEYFKLILDVAWGDGCRVVCGLVRGPFSPRLAPAVLGICEWQLLFGINCTPVFQSILLTSVCLLTQYGGGGLGFFLRQLLKHLEALETLIFFSCRLPGTSCLALSPLTFLYLLKHTIACPDRNQLPMSWGYLSLYYLVYLK